MHRQRTARAEKCEGGIKLNIEENIIYTVEEATQALEHVDMSIERLNQDIKRMQDEKTLFEKERDEIGRIIRESEDHGA